MPDGRCHHPIVVVEDDAVIRFTLHTLLTDEGYLVHAAKDGRSALTTVATLELPCVMLLDLTMPRMNGFQVIEELRRGGQLSQVYVVVMSGLGRDTPLPEGASTFLHKPITMDELFAALDGHCAKVA